MELIIPDNNDPNLIHYISDLINQKTKHTIKGIYGKPTKNTFLGSGRANILFDSLSNSKFLERVIQFKELGLNYDYTINGIMPRTRLNKNRNQIIEELKWLESSRITKITISNYELAKLAEQYAPSLELGISFFAGIRNEEQFIQWSSINNVKEINTDVSTYRNLDLLEKLVGIGENYNTKVRVIANLGCMADCIRKEEHAIIKDISSLDKNLHYAPCTFFCMKYSLENPNKLLKIPLIRPEDLDAYDNIGISSIKIVDRVQKSEWIKEVVGYYLNGSFKGNILDLTCTYTRLGLQKISNDDVLKIDMEKVISSRDNVIKYREILPVLMGVVIDYTYNFLSCDNTCKGCECDPKAIKYDNQRRETVLEQLNFLEKNYLFK